MYYLYETVSLSGSIRGSEVNYGGQKHICNDLTSGQMFTSDLCNINTNILMYCEYNFKYLVILLCT